CSSVNRRLFIRLLPDEQTLLHSGTNLGEQTNPVELGGTDERVDRCSPLAAGIGSRKQVILTAERNRSKRTLRGVVVDLDAPVVAIAQERRPARERIPDRSGKLRLLRQLPLCGD